MSTDNPPGDAPRLDTLLIAQRLKNSSPEEMAALLREDLIKQQHHLRNIVDTVVPEEHRLPLLHAFSMVMGTYTAIAMNEYKVSVKTVHDMDRDEARRAKKEAEKEISRRLAGEARHNDKGRVADMGKLLERVNYERAKQESPLDTIDMRTLRRHLGMK